MPQKILHITYDMQIGGTEQVIRNLVRGLDKSKFDCSILCIDGQIGPWGRELEAEGFKHHCLERKPGFDLDLIKSIRRIIKTENIDLVHCHQYTPYTYGWFGSILTGVPIVFTEHGRFYPDFSSAKRKLVNPLLQLRTNSITSISAATKEALIEFENFSRSKIDVLYNGIADKSLEINSEHQQELKGSLELEEGDIVFGTISRLDPIKNHPMMLRAFAKACNQITNLKLMIVGDGPEREATHQLTSELGLNDKVIFTGFQANPQPYLSLMDVFLLPSLSEGTSMTLLEAMSFKKPTIATAVGGTPEIVQDQQSGLLIKNEDEAGLVSALIELANDADKRSSYGESARKDYEQRFTLEAMIQQYSELYQKIF